MLTYVVVVCFLTRGETLGCRVLYVGVGKVAAITDAVLGDVANTEIRFLPFWHQIDEENVFRGEGQCGKGNASLGCDERSRDVRVEEINSHGSRYDRPHCLQLEVSNVQTTAIHLTTHERKLKPLSVAIGILASLHPNIPHIGSSHIKSENVLFLTVSLNGVEKNQHSQIAVSVKWSIEPHFGNRFRLRYVESPEGIGARDKLSPINT